MSGASLTLRRGVHGIGRRVGGFFSGVSAVGAKELRGRMRGRRAFVVVTVYLLLLSAFAFGIYTYLRQQADLGQMGPTFPGFPREPVPFPQPGFSGAAGLAATIGHALFSGLLIVETMLVLVLAPAFTSGAISLEREKQTLEMLVTTPLSRLGMVVGKLLSALVYVFLLIVASIPLASLVFVFGGVGPEDLIRGYVFLFALAFGMGAIGLFISALVRRTQTATVLTYVIVLALTFGTIALHQFLVVTTTPTPTGNVIVSPRHKAPEAMLWLNPFVANMDLVCTTVPGAYHDSCVYMSLVTGKPYFGSSFGFGDGGEMPRPAPLPMPDMPSDPGGGVEPDFGFGRAADGGVVVEGFVFRSAPGGWVNADDVDEAVAPQTTLSLGFPRDTFWPKSAAAFAGIGLLLTLASAQLVAPTRRLTLRRPVRRSQPLPASAPAATDQPPADDGLLTESDE
jgi:ABC-type transport system involved in multi-copper enzyme maturation permease subunit